MLLSLLLVVASATPQPAPAFESLVQQATASGKPIVLDFVTEWCTGCKMMDRNVFPDARVKALLGKVVFQKYDAEEAPGSQVASRFQITSFPTVLVLSPDGTRVGAVTSQDPLGFVRELSDLLPLAAVRGPFTEASLTERKAPAAAWLVAALRAREQEPVDPTQVKRLLTRAMDLDPKDAAGIGARAGVELMQDQLADHQRRSRLTTCLEFAERFPASVQAVPCLTTCAAMANLAPADRTRVVQAVRRSAEAMAAAKNSDRLNHLIYVLLALRENEAATRAAEALRPLAGDDTNLLDTVAETYFQTGRRAEAVALERTLIGRSPADKNLERNLKRFQHEQPVPLPIEDPESDAELVPATSGPSPEMMERFGEQMRLCTALAAACKDTAGKTATTYLRLHFKDDKLQRAVAFDLEAPKALRSCLEAAAAKQEYQLLASSPRSELKIDFAFAAGH